MKKRFRLLLIIAFVGIGVWFLLPTVRWYFVVPQQMKDLAAGSREQIRDYGQENARTDIDALVAAATSGSTDPVGSDFAFLVDQARANYRSEGREIPSTWTAEAVLAGFRDEQEAFDLIETHYRDELTELKSLKNRIITLGLDLSGGISVVLEADRDSLSERLGRRPTDEDLDEAIDRAMEILNNRIDQFGVTEPQIRRLEGGRISIEIPGDDDRERVNSFLMGKGSLGLYIVDDEATQTLIELQRTTPGWDPEVHGTDSIPAGVDVLPYVTRDEYGIDEQVRYIAIKSDIETYGLDGNSITEAQTSRDPITQQPVVNFVLNREGAEIFRRLTAANVGKSLAVVMDDKVRFYANISDEIGGGQVQVSGFSQEEADSMALVLRTAALPVDLIVLSQETVGAALGREAIDTGIRSIIVGFALVIVFMVVYYLRAGLIADIALVLNLFFLTAILSVFNLTLTLTSIAGIILTVGMAVDANVIIFERIREESRLGKTAGAAVEAGYQKALWTVLDANITTFIAAIFLSQLGSGPIEGFAVTLAVGIVSSMFTALVVSRLFFDFGTDVLNRQKLSIGWGR